MGPLINSTNKDELKKAFDEIEDYVDENDDDYKKRNGILPWLISAGLHGMMILIFGLIIYGATEKEKEYPPYKPSILPTPVVEKVKDRDIIERDNTVEIKVDELEIKNPVISQLDVPVTELQSEEDTVSDVPKGREEAVSDVEVGGVGAFMNIGAGSQGSGLLGSRTGGGKVRARGALGSQGRATDSSIEAGLRWLKRHQSPNGSWDAEKYVFNCDLNPKCEPGVSQAGDTNVAMTGYAVLCFLGAGYDHRVPSKFKKTVEAGVNYLVSIQTKDGLFGKRNYEHPVATMALSEAAEMGSDVNLKSVAQLGVNNILLRQAKGNSNYGLGWNYIEPNDERIDTSVTGWNVMALKSALSAGLQVGDGMVGCKEWLDRAYKSSNKNWEKLDAYSKAIFPYTWNSITNSTEKDHLSFVGALCAVFLGHHQGDILLETLCNDMEARWIDNGAYKNNNYASYYIVMTEFQSGGARWQKCLNTIIPYLINEQRKTEDCFDGSWDYANQQWHGSNTGRVLSTCYSILNLEVAYRYKKIK